MRYVNPVTVVLDHEARLWINGDIRVECLDDPNDRLAPAIIQHEKLQKLRQEKDREDRSRNRDHAANEKQDLPPVLRH
ncbi:hypothetical protein [Bradyrhizobium frederickii]|uniref:hypothetical protein n=1 Tax=Bradyrhizobium frederickii TaxID=2560054 RepID=UPI001ADD907C|nr:hypothetical protein [Bradyrhizobium frederickii]